MLPSSSVLATELSKVCKALDGTKKLGVNNQVGPVVVISFILLCPNRGQLSAHS